MAGNFLEQLLSEWYEYRGYFVRRNVLVGRRARGGYECELDVVAFHPQKKLLVHVEPSLDNLSWKKREERFKKKFAAGRKHIPGLFSGLELPAEPEQIAVLMFASTKNVTTIGGRQVVLVSDLLRDILRELRDKSPAKQAIPENLPLLRAYQLIAAYPLIVSEALRAQE